MPETLALQRSLASLILDAGPCPEEGLGVYRDLARSGLLDAGEGTFPVAMALLGADWEPWAQAFLEARCVRSPHYRDIAPAFLGWVAETGRGLDRWPFLLELLHWELLESLVTRCEEAPVPPLPRAPSLGACVVLDPAARVVTYAHTVHRATEEAPLPGPGPVHLLAYRDAEGRFQALELSPATALILTRPGTLGEALAHLGIADPAPALDLLRHLREGGAVAGFPAP